MQKQRMNFAGRLTQNKHIQSDPPAGIVRHQALTHRGYKRKRSGWSRAVSESMGIKKLVAKTSYEML